MLFSSNHSHLESIFQEAVYVLFTYLWHRKTDSLSNLHCQKILLRPNNLSYADYKTHDPIQVLHDEHKGILL